MTHQTPGSLVESLADLDERVCDAALADLIALGPQALPALLGEVRNARSTRFPLAMQALACIADPSCADDFYAAVSHPHEGMRAWAATGLANIHDPRATEALLATFDDCGIEMLGPHTLSSSALVAQGPAVLSRVVKLLGNDSEFTRERAYRVLLDILAATPQYQDHWRKRVKELGDYDPQAPSAQRTVAIRKWEAWIARHFAIVDP